MPAFYCILLSKHSLFIKLSSCHAIIRLTNVTQVSSTGTPGHILVNRYTRIKPKNATRILLFHQSEASQKVSRIAHEILKLRARKS